MRKSRRKQIQRKQLIFVFCGILVGVFGLTIGYAALSSTLNISGSVTVNSASWDYTFNKVNLKSSGLVNGTNGNIVDNYLVTGGATLNGEPVISDSSISNVDVTVTKPGDFIYLYYEFFNTGSVPMELTAINKTTPTFTMQNAPAIDIANAKKYFSYDLITFNKTSNIAMNVGDVLCPGDGFYLEIVLGYSQEATSMPTQLLNVSNIGGEVMFSQSTSNSCK